VTRTHTQPDSTSSCRGNGDQASGVGRTVQAPLLESPIGPWAALEQETDAKASEPPGVR
jgi:hypothetical protein